MVRITTAVAHKRRKKVLEEAKGYRGARSRSFRRAKEQVIHSRVYNYNHRKDRKGDFRRLWIVRINAGLTEHKITYSKFINLLHNSEFNMLNRKLLAELAVNYTDVFNDLVKKIVASNSK